MFTISFVIGALFFQNILAGDYSNLPGEISKQVAAQFLHRNRHSDSRCDKDEKYCESNRVSCMQHNENIREILCAKNNSCPTGQTCYLSNPCPANLSTGCTNAEMTLPGEIPHSIATQFLHRYKRSDPRCNTDETYCETNLVSCMQHNENSREYFCGLNNPCSSGQTCYLSTPCPVHYRTGCTSNACYGQPCQNGGTCSLASNAKGYTCHCNAGYDQATDCRTQIDYCSSNPCQNGATCNRRLNGYTCTCQPGFNGVHCQNNIDECASSPCVHGTCADQINGYTCSCDPGYTGVNCQIDINECQSSPCIYGNCTDHVNMYTCECFLGYTGINCETDINECISSPCIHGTCIDEIARYSCSCDILFIGDNCEKVIASYIVTIAVGALGIIATAVGLFVIWRKKQSEKNSTVPFPFEETKLGQTRSRFQRNVETVHTNEQNSLWFIDGKLGQGNMKFKNQS